ncbi:urea amidolyase [Thioclava sediminum]|uniref:Urea amidolyase n=1 Tax=Thioclava sediminum TaxID=1915319 RepID=A0ABX3N0X8_9RHOB|nr:urea amidolyase [Thioclava sediminum]OOY25616.1 urea amidolyase [Thioclava sediminum]
MSGGSVILRALGPSVSVQDMGRPGRMAQGISRGGAVDPLALVEAAALLGSRSPLSALEMAVSGGRFEVTAPTRIALTGAPMQAELDGRPLRWGASHRMEPGEVLSIGAARTGMFGYLTFAGGIETPVVLGSRSAHLAAGIGSALESGARLPLGVDPEPDAPAMVLTQDDRFSGGTLRIIPGPQTGLFDEDTFARLTTTEFTRARQGNRQGVALESDAPALTSDKAEGLASDVIFEGDIQMTGAGTPYVLLAECQTIGGYPRIGTVLPCDLPRVAQAAPGTKLRFKAVTLDEADALAPRWETQLQAQRAKLRPLIRDPHDIHDLLGYQLISGVTVGRELEEENG